MADAITLLFRKKSVTFEKSAHLVAARARAGMSEAMQDDIDVMTVGKTGAKRGWHGAFELIELNAPKEAIEQHLDWLRGRPAVAVASHVFHVANSPEPYVPTGKIHVIFETGVLGHEQQTILSQYRLQAVEARGSGDFLVTVTTGSKNPIATAAALQQEAGIAFAEPEFVTSP